MRKLAVVLAALAATGCGRGSEAPSGPGALPEPEVTLDLVSPRLTAAIVIRATSNRTEFVDIVFDGVLVAEMRTGVNVTVPASLATQGSHEIFAAIELEGRVYRSASVHVTVDALPPEFVASDPPAGPVVVAGPFTLRATFGEEVSSVVEAQLSVYDGENSTGWQVPVTVTGVSGREVTLEVGDLGIADGPWRSASLMIRTCDGLANCGWSTLGPWTALMLTGTVTVPYHQPVSGLQPVSAWWNVDLPVNLLVDGVVMGTLSKGVAFQLDTRLLADGQHTVAIGAPGVVAPSPREARLLLTDNTPPHLVSCVPNDAPADDPSVSSGVIATFDESVVLDGATYGGVFALVVRPPAPGDPFPAQWTVDLSAARDDASNPVGGAASCTFPIRPWRAPRGEGPVAIGGTPLTADAVATHGWGVFLERAGEEPDRRIQFAWYDGEAATWGWYGWTFPGALAPAGLATASRGSCGWLAADGVHTCEVSGQPVPDSVLAGLELLAVGPEGGVVFAGDDGGVRRVVASWVAMVQFCETPFYCYSRSQRQSTDLSSGPSEAAIAWPFVVERRGAASGDLWVLRLPGQGTAGALLPGPLDADAVADAREPSIDGEGTVAWIEGGQPFVRRLLPNDVWSAPVALSTSTGCREPRVLDGRVVFVESTAQGDRFEVRRWAAASGTWDALTPLDAGGPVGSWSVARPGGSGWQGALQIAWLDSEGHVRVRHYNE